jgi:Protein of unknown function (DUF3592)
MIDDRPGTFAQITRLISKHHVSIFAGLIFVVVIGFFEIGPWFGAGFGRWLLSFPMPAVFDSNEARVILLFFVFLFLVIAGALLLKSFEQWDIERWAEAEADIVRSQAGFRLIKRAKGMPDNHRIADIGYRFQLLSLAGEPKVYSGSRIRIDEIIPEEEVEALLARYPKGSRVRIFYDPVDPTRNVLEREADGGRTIKGLFAVAVLFAIIALPIMWLATNGPGALKTIPLKPAGWVSLICGLVATGFFWGEFKQRRWLASLRGWTKTTGVVVSSSIEVYDSGHRRNTNSGTVSKIVINYTPVVEYRYEVGGVQHLSRSIQADMKLGGSEEFARGYASRYAPGKQVEVAYDPANPHRASLEPTTGFGWTFIIAGSGFALVALAAAFLAWR